MMDKQNATFVGREIFTRESWRQEKTRPQVKHLATNWTDK